MAKTPKMSVKETNKDGAQPPKPPRGGRSRKVAEPAPPPSRGKPETRAAEDSQAASLQAAEAAGSALAEQVPPKGARKASTEEIARRAYELYQKRGGGHGSDREDWLRAERELTDDGDGAGSHRDG